MEDLDLRKEYVSLFTKLHEVDGDLAERFEAYVRAIREDALTDALTELPNRELFLAQANTRLEQAIKSGKPVSLALLDIDNFKGVNDKRGFREVKGYDGGDLLLKRTGILLRQSVRPDDVVGRYGGEEFAILAPDAATDEAEPMAERLIERMSRYHKGETVSVGLTFRDPATQEVSVEDLVKEANIGLKHAKKEGKNRFVWYTPGMVDPELSGRA